MSSPVLRAAAWMVGAVLSRPLEGFVAQSRRAELVDIGTGALERMSRDIRMAVPGSLRVSADGQALELLLIHSAGRYLPNRVLAGVRDGAAAARIPLLAGRVAVDGRATAYVCRDYACDLPVTEPAALGHQLDAV